MGATPGISEVSWSCLPISGNREAEAMLPAVQACLPISRNREAEAMLPAAQACLPISGTGKRTQCSQPPGSRTSENGLASPTHGLFSFTGPCAWTFSWAGLHWSSKRIYTGFSLAVLLPLPRDSEADSQSFWSCPRWDWQRSKCEVGEIQRWLESETEQN